MAIGHPGGMPPSDQSRSDAILDAALEQFAAYGYARSSMADIAEASGLSRAGLYLQFPNKESLYRAVLQRTLAHATSAALDALMSDDTLEQRLDTAMQRTWGDLSTWTLGTQHGADLFEAKQGLAADISSAHTAQVREQLTDTLAAASRAASDDEIRRWVDILVLSPLGLRYDQPSIQAYRERLSGLASAVAAAVKLGAAESGA